MSQTIQQKSLPYPDEVSDLLTHIEARMSPRTLTGGMKRPPIEYSRPEKSAWVIGHAVGQHELAAAIGDLLAEFHSRYDIQRGGEETYDKNRSAYPSNKDDDRLGI